MECGLIGMQGVGKTTLFQALTAHAVPVQAGGMKPNLGIAPMHFDRLLFIALDGRDPHPDVGMAARGVPTFDLVRQQFAIGGEADVLALGLRMAEIEKLPVQPNPQRKVFLQRRCRQVRPRGRGDDVKRARVLPVAQISKGLGRADQHGHQSRCQQRLRAGEIK